MPVHFVRGLVGFGGSRHRGDGGSAMKFAELRSQGSAGRFSRHFPNRFDRRRGRLVGLVLCLVGVFSGGAHGYRFYWSSPDGSLVPKAAAAERWDPALWGPGATLRFFVAADPAWTARWEDEEGETQPPAFEDVEEALPFVTEALAAWSAVGSADIRWETTGVEAGPGIAEDRRNGVTVTDPPDAEFWGQASIWSEWKDEARDEWWTVECDIELVPAAAAHLGSDAPDNLATLIHEFGHCLGLDHAASHSEWAGWLDRAPGVFGEAPKMSYGWSLTNELGDDDIVGASLLRPASSWRGSTGSISGLVATAGQPARHVAVVTVAGPGGARGVGAFTDEEGRFLIEGLPPGDYRVRAGPFLNTNAHFDLLEGGAALAVHDALLLGAVRVRAGEETGGLRFDLPPGRRGTAWVE